MVQSQLHELTLLATRRAYPDIALPQFVVSHPENEDHGDYSVNIALVLARQINQSSSSVADNILSNFGPMAIVDRVEIAGPGFINFYLKPNFFWSHVEQAIELASNYGRDQAVSGKRIIFEYGQPNTHKVAHIGHLYSYCYGESCSRLLEATGSDVIRANYQGDIGPHVAKCLFAYLKNNLPDPESLSDKVAYLQECYQQGSTAYDDP